MKVIGRFELNEINQKLDSLGSRYTHFPSIKFLGKQGDHLEIKLKTKLSTFIEKINPFLEYIGLSLITLGGCVGFSSWRNSYSEAKKNWDKGIRVEIIEINADDALINTIQTLWDTVFIERKVSHFEYDLPSFFDLYINVPVNERTRLSEAVLKLVNASPKFSKGIYVSLESMSAEYRIAVAEAVLPLVDAVKHKWVKNWYGLNVISALAKAPLEEIDSIAKAALPLIQEDPNGSESFIDVIRRLPKEERENVVNGALEVVRSGKFTGYDAVRCVEFVRKIPVPYRAKFIELAVQINQISPHMPAQVLILKSIAKIFKNPTAVEMADTIINALSKIPVNKSGFLHEALNLVDLVFLYKKEPDRDYFDSCFREGINQAVKIYSKDL